MKLVKWIALAVVLVLIVVGVVVYLNLNRIVRVTVERQSTQQLTVPTTVGGARVSIFGGSVGLDDFRVSSPKGFDAEHMFTLQDVNVDVRLRELRQDPVHIRSIAIRGPVLVVEQRGTEFNFKTLMDQMPDHPQTEEPPLRLLIDNLTITDTAVIIRSNLPGLPPEMTVKVPSIALQNIGTGEGAANGAAVKDVVMLLVTTLVGEAYQSDLIPPELRKLLESDLRQVAADLVTQQIGQVTEQLREKLPGEIGETIGGMLEDPELRRDPGKAIERGVEGLIRGNEAPTTQPAETQPSPQQEIGRAVEGLLRDRRPQADDAPPPQP